MGSYQEYGQQISKGTDLLLRQNGFDGLPTEFKEFMRVPIWIRKMIGNNLPLVMSDNYEHFMACLPGKKYAGHHVLIRKQIGGFTVAAGFWKWLEFLSHQITHQEVSLVADYFSGKHNNNPRPFDKNYWHHVVDDFDGYMPIIIEYLGEGATFTGVPFPVAQIYGEKPAVWVNEPPYIQVGHLSHVATIAAQFAEVLGDPKRFIEVSYRALQNSEGSDDVLLAMLIGGGIVSTSNDLGAFIHGAPFMSAGTTGHCCYAQWENFKEALREILSSKLGPSCTVLLDPIQHEYGFKVLCELLEEGLPVPRAERPDSGETLKLGLGDLTVLEEAGKKINVVFEDGYKPRDVLVAEIERRQRNIEANRTAFGGGGAFVALRSALETAYKACYFHDGSPRIPINEIDTMKICLDDPMKQSVPGMIDWLFNKNTGLYTLGSKREKTPEGLDRHNKILYDGLSNPGRPYFDLSYDPDKMTTCKAVVDGAANSKNIRSLLGPDFTLKMGENKTPIAMTSALFEKKRHIYESALELVRNT